MLVRLTKEQKKIIHSPDDVFELLLKRIEKRVLDDQRFIINTTSHVLTKKLLDFLQDKVTKIAFLNDASYLSQDEYIKTLSSFKYIDIYGVENLALSPKIANLSNLEELLIYNTSCSNWETNLLPLVDCEKLDKIELSNLVNEPNLRSLRLRDLITVKNI